MRCARRFACASPRRLPAEPVLQRACAATTPTARRDRALPRDAGRRRWRTARAPMIGMCTPESKIAGTVCLREADCPAGQGCVLYGARTSLRVCRAGGTKSLGSACAGGRRVPQRRVLRPRLPRQRRPEPRATARGRAASTATAVPDQTCARLVVGNNGTPRDPLDDLVVGYCRTLFAPIAAAAAERRELRRAPERLGRLRHRARPLLQEGRRRPASPVHDRVLTARWAPNAASGPRFARRLLPDLRLRRRTATLGRRTLCPGTSSACAQRGGPDEPISACYEKCVPGGGRLQPRERGLRRANRRRRRAPASICLVASGT